MIGALGAISTVAQLASSASESGSSEKKGDKGSILEKFMDLLNPQKAMEKATDPFSMLNEITGGGGGEGLLGGLMSKL